MEIDNVMITFSIVCLVIILSGIQHLLNWMWRKVDGEAVVPAAVLTVFSIIITWFCIYHIILWGKNLI